MTKPIISVVAATALSILGSVGAASAQDTITLRLAHGTSPESTYAKTTEFLSQRLDELTDGRIKIREFGGGSLGSETSTLDLYGTGDIDMGFHFTSAMAPVVKEMGFFDVPFLFDDLEHWKTALVSEEGKDALQAILDRGNYPFSIGMVGLSGQRNIYTKDTVIDSMDALQGFKIRVPESPIAAQVWRAVGMSPTTVPWPDVYSALEAGLVNGAENTPHWYYDAKHIEVAKNYHWTRHLFGTSFVLISNDALASIPEDLKDEFQMALAEAETFWTDHQVAADEETVETHFPKYNVIQHEVPESVKAGIREKVGPLAEELAGEFGTQDLLSHINDTRAAD
jgi:TRAP-type C4-dicarboxylate transport system substrate-binding protein